MAKRRLGRGPVGIYVICNGLIQRPSRQRRARSVPNQSLCVNHRTGAAVSHPITEETRCLCKDLWMPSMVCGLGAVRCRRPRPACQHKLLGLVRVRGSVLVSIQR